MIATRNKTNDKTIVNVVVPISKVIPKPSNKAIMIIKHFAFEVIHDPFLKKRIFKSFYNFYDFYRNHKRTYRKRIFNIACIR